MLLLACFACSDERARNADAGGVRDDAGGDATRGEEDAGAGVKARPLSVTLDVKTYTQQPMVADLTFSVPDLAVTIKDQGDPGVRSGIVSGDAAMTSIRVRGLAPDTMHEIAWSAKTGEGRSAKGTVMVHTPAALPGFQPTFPIGGTGDPYNGYVVFDYVTFGTNPQASIFVVDAEGTTRFHASRGEGPRGQGTTFVGLRLRPDGSLLYLRGNELTVVDELGAAQVSMSAPDLGIQGFHHDVIELPNGNFMALSHSFRDIEYSDLGLTHVVGDVIVEVTPQGKLVWTWDAFDHLDPQRRRPGFEETVMERATGETANDWTHGNGLVYDAASNTILYSTRHQDWIVKIDHATGAVLWRFGDEGDFTLTSGTWPYHQHSPQWQDDGTLLLYDNGFHNPNVDDDKESSRAVRYAIDEAAMTAEQVWEDDAEAFLVPVAGDADRLPDGSLLVTDSSIGFLAGKTGSHARIREIDEATSATPRWTLTTDLGAFIYRCTSSSRLPGESP
jgi:hypothetical protein